MSRALLNSNRDSYSARTTTTFITTAISTIATATATTIVPFNVINKTELEPSTKEIPSNLATTIGTSASLITFYDNIAWSTTKLPSMKDYQYYVTESIGNKIFPVNLTNFVLEQQKEPHEQNNTESDLQMINNSVGNLSGIESDYNTTLVPFLDRDDTRILSTIFSWQGLCLLAVFFTFVVITIIGNTLVILAVITTRRLRTVTNCFVMSLAVADLLVGIFVMPPAVAVHILGSWPLGWILCDIWISLDVLLCTASILSLCAISVDRYLAVTQPLTYSRKRRSKRLALIMILIVWSLALAITCPPILGWYEPGRRDLTECRYNQNEGYVIFSAMGSFFIPMTVMIYVYARISCVIASRHDNMTDIIHNKKSKKFHTVDTEAEHDQMSSEQDLSPGQKKQTAARTLSNQTIAKEITDVIIVEDNGMVRQPNNKNGSSYELIPTSRTPSFRRQPTLNIPKGHQQQSTSPGNKSAEHWTTYGRHSVRHHHNTTCIIGGGNDTYVTRNTRVHHQKSLSNRITSLKKENKTTQTLSIVVGGFIACWLPFFINYIITPFLTKEQVNAPLAEFLTWLGWFNSAVNPFIYAFYSVDFRAAFWRLTLKRFFRNSSKGQFPNNTMSIRR